MSAAGRLWRRAPLWRLSLGATLTFAALTALYPQPPLERALSSLLARDPRPGAATGVSVPPLAPARNTLTAFAGRSLPLPPGDWHEVLAGRFEPQTEVNEIVLARLQRGRLTGLIDASGTTGPSKTGLGLPQACLDPTNYAAHVPPGHPDRCWLIRDTPPSPPGPPSTILDAARDRLARLGVIIPSAMTRAVWFRTAGGEFMTVQIDLPARPDRTEAWMKRWSTLLDRGFEGTLHPSQMNAQGSALDRVSFAQAQRGPTLGPVDPRPHDFK